MASKSSEIAWKGIINPFKALISDLHDDMIEKDFKKAKLYSRQMLGSAILEKIQTPLELFKKLEDHNFISEDDTSFLEQMYEHIKNKDGLEDIEKYKRKREVYRDFERLMAVKSDPLFVGRDDELMRIMNAFVEQRGKCCCVVLAGPPGIGKTKVSIKTCAIFSAFVKDGGVVTPYLVNLRNVASFGEAGAAIMNAIGFKEISPTKFSRDDLLQWQPPTNSETIIYLDNADDILRPKRTSRDDFTNFLCEFLKESNQRIKILITTRYKIDNDFLRDSKNFHQLDLKPLQLEDAESLLHRSSGIPSLDDELCTSLVSVCGRNPHAIRALASRLKQGPIKPKKLLELLQKPVPDSRILDCRYQMNMTEDGQEIEQQESVLRCLAVLFNQLDKDSKKYLIKLSVFPSFFYEDVASVILDEDESMISLYLQDLCIYGVLESEKLDQFVNIASGTGNVNQYNLHTLVRMTCAGAINEDDTLRQLRDTAMAAFLKHYHQVLNKISEVANVNFKEGLDMYQNDKINLIQYIEHEAKIRSQQTAKELDFSIEDKRYLIIESLFDADRRSEYFKNALGKAEKEKDWITYSFMCAWHGEQYISQAKMTEAHEFVDKGLTTLEILNSSEKHHHNAMIAKAACLYVKGRAFAKQQEYNDSLDRLQKSLDIRTKLERDHTMTARALNAIGNVFYLQRKLLDAQRYHEQAWQMINIITEGKPEVHLDSSVYVMNLGTCFRSWGNRHMDANEPEKGEQQYNKALEWFDKALNMQQSSFPGLEIEQTAKILKNRALCHFELEDYSEALPDAVKSLNITQRIFKNENPETARCLYFVGTTHHHIGKKTLKSTKVSEDERAVAHKNFEKALKFLEDAYDMEHKLGPDRRSKDYEELKMEIVDVLKSMGEDEDATVRWQQRFAETDKQKKSEIYNMTYEKVGPPTSSPATLGDDASALTGTPPAKKGSGNCHIA